MHLTVIDIVIFVMVSFTGISNRRDDYDIATKLSIANLGIKF